jgi:hypothetical protein
MLGGGGRMTLRVDHHLVDRDVAVSGDLDPSH